MGRLGARLGMRRRRATAEGRARPRAPSRTARERLGALHPAADRHLAARGRGAARRVRRLHQLPVAPLPRVDLPTINVTAALPGASPETMASAVATPLERRFGRIAGVSEITSTSSLGQHLVTLQFDLDRDVDAAARDVQAAINAAARRPAAEPPHPAQLPQGQPGRLAHPDPLADLQDLAAGAGVRRRQHRPGPEDLAGGRRRPGHRGRRAAAGRARPGRPGGARRHRAHARGRAERDQRRHHQPAQGRLNGHAQTQTRRRQRSDLQGRRLRAADHRRYSNGAAVRLGDVAKVIDDVENNRVGRLDQRGALGAAHRPAAARRQHHRRDRAGQGAPARALRTRSRRPSTSRSRSIAARPSAPRCTTSSFTLVLSASARGAGGLRLPALAARHARSPASRCRSRSSAPSASCTCSATASTTCP